MGVFSRWGVSTPREGWATVTTPLFEAERVTRRYREVPVVDEVSVAVNAGGDRRPAGSERGRQDHP